jgi:hypothetical protein
VVLTLTCENAIAAAERELPTESGRVARVEFHHGGYCPPPPRKCAVALPNTGYVVFTFDDGTALWATVLAKGLEVNATFQGAFPPA